jgi:hypothetical protein
MANQEYLDLLRRGVEVWNQWRRDHSDMWPDLDGVEFAGADLSRVNLSKLKLSRTNFSGTNLSHADLWGADLRERG